MLCYGEFGIEGMAQYGAESQELDNFDNVVHGYIIMLNWFRRGKWLKFELKIICDKMQIMRNHAPTFPNFCTVLSWFIIFGISESESFYLLSLGYATSP